MSRIYRKTLVIGVLAVFLGAGLSSQEPATLRVIVHPSNQVAAMSPNEVSRLFLRQVTRWPSGQRVLPVNLIAGSPGREAFSSEITHKSLAAERAFWQRQIFSGRGVPPVEVATEQEVLAFVARNPGAIGYVSRIKLNKEVRELKIRDTEASDTGAP